MLTDELLKDNALKVHSDSLSVHQRYFSAALPTLAMQHGLLSPENTTIRLCNRHRKKGVKHVRGRLRDLTEMAVTAVMFIKHLDLSQTGFWF